MTIQEALDLADQMKPNMMARPVKLRFLSELEGMIHGELLMQHWHRRDEEERPVYDTETDPGTELLAPAPYDMVYVYWLESRIDEQNQEMDKYNNDRMLFENAYQQLSDWWNRTKMPVRRVREIRI